MRMISRFLCFSALLLAACDSPTSLGREVALVEFRTDRSAYAPGDSLTLRTTNRSSLSISYGLCAPVLHRLVQGTWSDVSAPLVCASPRYPLPPGSATA